MDIDEGSADLSSQHAWVLNSPMAALSAKDSTSYAVDYRFARDPTSAQLQADMDRLRASLPPGSVTSSVAYLLIRGVFDITNRIITSEDSCCLRALGRTGRAVLDCSSGYCLAAWRG